LIENVDYVTSLFQKLQSPTNTDEELLDLLQLLQELCNLAKSLQPSQKTEFYETLIEHGLFPVVELTLPRECVKVRLSCVDLMSNIMLHCPCNFRDFLLKEKPDYVMFNNIINQILKESDLGLLSQLLEIVRALVDTENIENGALKEEFLELFYKEFLVPLISPLNEGNKVEKMAPLEEQTKTEQNEQGKGKDIENNCTEKSQENQIERRDASLLHELCELLGFCLQQHGYHIKHFILHNNIVSKVLALLVKPQKHLVLAALRFFRALVGIKDDFLNKHILKHKLFKPVVDLFLRNGPKYNLINSAILELFDFIVTENMKSLIKHIVINFEDQIRGIDYVKTFDKMLLKYEQMKDFEENHINNNDTESQQALRAQAKIINDIDEDEDYFFGEEEDGDVNYNRTWPGSNVGEFRPRIPTRDYDEPEFRLASGVRAQNTQASAMAIDNDTYKRKREEKDLPTNTAPNGEPRPTKRLKFVIQKPSNIPAKRNNNV